MRPAGQSTPADATVCNTRMTEFFSAHPEYRGPGYGMIADSPWYTDDGIDAFNAANPDCAPSGCAQVLEKRRRIEGMPGALPGQPSWLSTASLDRFAADNPTCVNDPAVTAARTQAAFMESTRGGNGLAPSPGPGAVVPVAASSPAPVWAWILGSVVVASAAAVVVTTLVTRKR